MGRKVCRSIQQFAGERCAKGHVRGALDPGQFRMTTDSSGGAAWCIEQDEWIEISRLPVPQVGANQLDLKAKAREIGNKTLKTRGVALERRDLCAANRQLRALATWRRAQIKHPRPADLTKEP